MSLATSLIRTSAVCLITLTAYAWQHEHQPPASSEKPDVIPPPPDVSMPPEDAEKSPSGLASKLLVPGTGLEHPADNDCVSIIFRAWRRDGTLFSTSGLGDQAITQCLRPAMPGIAQVLKLMVTGEKRRVWLPASLTAPAVAHHEEKHMGNEEHAHLVDLTFDLQLTDIFQAPDTPSDITSPPKGSVRLQSGVLMQVLKPGTGTRHPSATSWITLDYSGWTTDGNLFESTILGRQPRLVQFGMTLPGWQEALLKMVVGEKVRLWIPAAMAYGANSGSKFVPSGDLIFDLEILSFT